MSNSHANLPSKIAVLGATGSVGSQALDVAKHLGIEVDLLTANRDVDKIEKLAREFLPTYCVMADEDAARNLQISLADTPIKVLGGERGILEAINLSQSEVVVNAILGAAGLKPTLQTLNSGKRLALSNKESLVVAGDIVMALAKEKKAEIIPVDSEHSAIFQSLAGGKKNEVKNLWLTASGGPFFGKKRKELEKVTLKETLAHPTWKMGQKITVDSADLMNKGFEVIEAVHLFGVCPDNIRVFIHRESIIHSAVEYIDGTVIAEMSVPDMRMCVQYALSYPNRVEGNSPALDLTTFKNLSFASPDMESFPLLSLAFDAIRLGGAVPCILNAVNEIAVSAFLAERLSFVGIGDTVLEIVDRLSEEASHAHSLDEILFYDEKARHMTREFLIH